MFARYDRRDGGGRISFPFQLAPRLIDDVTDNLKAGVYFLQMGEDGVLWTGYYTEINGAKQAVENYCGVWFKLQYHPVKQTCFATRVVPDSFNLVHHPASNINLSDLKFQTTQHGEPDLTQPAPPNIFGVAHTHPAPVTSRLPASRPTIPLSYASDQADQANDDARSDDSTPRTSQAWTPSWACNADQTPRAQPLAPRGGGDPNEPLIGNEREMANFLRRLRGDGLEGTPPKAYNGERSDTQRFILAFDCYSLMNHTAIVMQDPMKRTALFLGLLDGKALPWADKVATWVENVCDGRETLPFGCDVWQGVKRKFRENFTDFADANKAYQELETLKMKEGRLDEYIATFEELATRASMELSTPNTMNTFAKGLQGSLTANCIQRDDPKNFSQWVQSAQQHHRRWLKIQALKGPSPFQKARPSTNPVTWRQNNTNQGNFHLPTQMRDPDTMDVDAIRKATTEEDKAKYRHEGRCYNCGRQGHLSRLCPDKKPNWTPPHHQRRSLDPTRMLKPASVKWPNS